MLLLLYQYINMSSVFQQQNIRTTQLVQDYHPVLRRRAQSSIRTSFPGFFSTQHQQHQQSLPPQSMSESQKSIYDNFSRINHIIDVVDQHIRKRIQCYQNEVVNVVQKEIEQMRQQTQKVVAQFNTMILEKNKQQQIWSLNNELDYFKSQAKKLYESNKHLKNQNLQLTKKNQQYQWELQNRQVIMQKLLYKYQKERHSKNKLKLKIHTQLGINQQQNINYIHCEKYYEDENENNRASIIAGLQQSSPQSHCIKHDVNKQTRTKSSNKLQFFTINKNNNNENLLQQNSLLQIDYEEDDQQLGQISNQKAKRQKKPELKDQQSQANIYLSQHWYKALFEKDRAVSKIGNKKLMNVQTMTQQRWTQTKSPIVKLNSVDNNKRKIQRQQKQLQKSKCIDLIKNGFSILQPSKQKKHHRTQSYCSNTTAKREISTGGLFNQRSKLKKQRMNTEMNFHQSRQNEFDFELLTPKQSTTNSNNKLFYKMATKFQRNKIAERAYDKNNIHGVDNKK